MLHVARRRVHEGQRLGIPQIHSAIGFRKGSVHMNARLPRLAEAFRAQLQCDAGMLGMQLLLNPLHESHGGIGELGEMWQ
jgi:hypothetical protein